MITETLELNKSYNMDCVEGMKMLPDNSIDLTVTSPPYDNLRTYNGFSWDFEATAKELYRITKQGGIVVWVVGDSTIKGSETGTSFKQALFFKQIGFNLHDTMIYEKPPRGAVGNNRGYWQSFEYMFVLSKGKPKTINLIKDRKNSEARGGDKSTKRLKDGTLKHISRSGYGEFGRRTNIWKYEIGKGQSTKDDIAFKHPAIFPEKLAKDHIISWSNEGDVVLDPFMGSGTTAKMAILNNRNYIGFEISKEYCDVAEQRIAEVKGGEE
jgi:site-specific DNA-methyltransferase (adenine-specific)